VTLPPINYSRFAKNVSTFTRTGPHVLIIITDPPNLVIITEAAITGRVEELVDIKTFVVVLVTVTKSFTQSINAPVN